MKKLTALLLVVILVVGAITSCGGVDFSEKSEGVMTYEEYVAADLKSNVVIEGYVQATQSWWDNKITVYLADTDGGYFIYEMACTEENAAKLEKGAKIKVTGVKDEWKGEIEVVDASFEFVEFEHYVLSARDLTDKIGNNEEIIKYQNELVAFKGMTVSAINYKGGTPGDDIYVTAEKDGKSIDFCVERYLTAPDTDVYKAFTEETVKVGSVIDIECFLYWYDAPNPHITKVAVK